MIIIKSVFGNHFLCFNRSTARTFKKHEKVNVPNIGLMRLFTFFDQNHDFYSLQWELKVLVEKFLKTSTSDEINQILDPEKISKNLSTIKCENDTAQLGGFQSDVFSD